MVVNSKKEFLTARQHPKLVLIKPDINGDVLTLSAPGVETVVNVNITSLFSEIPIKAYVWEQEVEVADAGDEVAKWVSQLMLQEDEGLRLVFYLSSLPTRDVREKFKVFETVTPDDTGAFHDATSFMMINESSIDDLNTRVEKSVKPLQFRPNFVVKGPEPYEEDKWNWVRVGDAIFRNVKPCTRLNLKNKFLKYFLSWFLFQMRFHQHRSIHGCVRQGGRATQDIAKLSKVQKDGRESSDGNSVGFEAAWKG